MELTAKIVRGALHAIANEDKHVELIARMLNNSRSELVTELRELVQECARRRNAARYSMVIKGIPLEVELQSYTAPERQVIYAEPEKCHEGHPAEAEFGAVYFNDIEISDLIVEMGIEDEVEAELIRLVEDESDSRPMMRRAA